MLPPNPECAPEPLLSQRPAWGALLTLSLALALPADAARVVVSHQIDLAPLVSTAPAGSPIRGLALDEASLWVLAPNSDELLELDPQSGSLRKRVPLDVAGGLQGAGMTFGVGDLWIADAVNSRVLRVGRDGTVRSVLPIQGAPRGIAMGAEGELQVFVPAQGGSAAHVERFAVTLQGEDALPPGTPRIAEGHARATASVAGGEYLWVSAPRDDETRLEGDVPEEGGAFSLSSAEVAPPDDTLPRGSESPASTHRLVLVDAQRGNTPLQIFPSGAPRVSLAATGAMIFYPAAERVIDVAVVLGFTDIEYGACVCRDVDFSYGFDWTSTNDNARLNFANPWDESMCTGAVCAGYEKDATGGYLAQRVVSSQDVEPPTDFMQSVIFDDGAGRIVRHSRSFPFGDAHTGLAQASYTVTVELCEAHYNIFPNLVQGLASIPGDVQDLYSYDGDSDGFGDDDPAVVWDDFFDLDTAVVHAHLLASGALSETNLYYRVRRILHYVKSRHVYSGSDGGWAPPADKLVSPYSSCSPSAFMVVALAREAGIPARLVGTTKDRSGSGGYPALDESFHRWAQVYLPPYGWLRVDATPSDPASVGMTDLDGDGEYTECDLCTSAAQCQARYGLTLADCGLSAPLSNPNDTDADGDVDGDDVASFGAGYYSDARLDSGLFSGVGTKDLLTIVAPGLTDVSSDRLRKHYIARFTDTGNTEGNTDHRQAEWTNAAGLSAVTMDDGTIFWTYSDPCQEDALVRIDLYAINQSGSNSRYEFVAALATNVSASAQQADVDLSNFSGLGDYKVVVTRQGGTGTSSLGAIAQADWETFGQTPSFQLNAPPAVPGLGVLPAGICALLACGSGAWALRRG